MRKNLIRFLIGAVSLLTVAVFAADEIKVTAQLYMSKGEVLVEQRPGSLSISMLGTHMSDIVQTIGTNATQITIAAGVATNGVFWMKNCTTNSGRYIDIGCLDVNTNFVDLLRLNPTEVQVGRFCPTNVPYARAYMNTLTNSVDLRMIILEN